MKLSGPNMNTNNNPTKNQVRNTQQDVPKSRYTTYKPDWTYTPFKEPIETMLRKLVSSNLIMLLITSNYEPQVKPTWWKDNKYCEFHKGKYHRSNNCPCLKNIIQDLIDWGKIEIDGINHKISNIDHTIFKNPLPSYEKGITSHQGKNNDNNANYTRASHDYTVNNIT